MINKNKNNNMKLNYKYSIKYYKLLSTVIVKLCLQHDSVPRVHLRQLILAPGNAVGLTSIQDRIVPS